MALTLPNWSPHPRQSPLGLLGLLIVLAFLLLTVDDVQQTAKGLLLCAALFLAGLGLCLFSLVKERSKLYGYTGMIGTVLYAIGNFMAFLVGPGKLAR
jgi:predicted branched-subunit amino acid permease